MPEVTPIIVRVGKVPGSLTNVALNGDRTVLAAFVLANISKASVESDLSNGYDLRVNGEVKSLTDTVANGDAILLTKQIKGN